MGEKRHELCCNCGNETGKAGRADDSIYVQSYGPLCEKCYDDFRATVLAENEKPDLHASLAEAREALRHAVQRTHDYAPDACSGCEAARNFLDANAREVPE